MAITRPTVIANRANIPRLRLRKPSITKTQRIKSAARNAPNAPNLKFGALPGGGTTNDVVGAAVAIASDTVVDVVPGFTEDGVNTHVAPVGKPLQPGDVVELLGLNETVDETLPSG